MSYDSEKFSNLIGVEYEEKDCWGIVIQFYKQVFGLNLKQYYSEASLAPNEASKNIFLSMGDFVETSTPTFGNIILFKIKEIPCHIGIYLDGRKFLHSSKTTNCVIDSLVKWERSVIAYYRVK